MVIMAIWFLASTYACTKQKCVIKYSKCLEPKLYFVRKKFSHFYFWSFQFLLTDAFWFRWRGHLQLRIVESNQLLNRLMNRLWKGETSILKINNCRFQIEWCLKLLLSIPIFRLEIALDYDNSSLNLHVSIAPKASNWFEHKMHWNQNWWLHLIAQHDYRK